LNNVKAFGSLKKGTRGNKGGRKKGTERKQRQRKGKLKEEAKKKN